MNTTYLQQKQFCGKTPHARMEKVWMETSRKKTLEMMQTAMVTYRLILDGWQVTHQKAADYTKNKTGSAPFVIRLLVNVIWLVACQVRPNWIITTNLANCHRCNLGLGHFDEDPSRLAKA